MGCKIKNKYKMKKWLLIILLIFIGYIICVASSICLYSSIDERTKSDAVIVLGAGVWENKPSPVFEERIKHGIWLYKNGYADKIIFTGGKGKNNEYSDAYTARNYAMENSVPFEDIFIEEQSTITDENLFYAAKIAADNHGKL